MWQLQGHLHTAWCPISSDYTEGNWGGGKHKGFVLLGYNVWGASSTTCFPHRTVTARTNNNTIKLETNRNSVSVSVSAETENAVSAAVSVTAVTGKSDFGRSLNQTRNNQMRIILNTIRFDCHNANMTETTLMPRTAQRRNSQNTGSQPLLTQITRSDTDLYHITITIKSISHIMTFV